MKGPFERLKYDLRRLWECPACQRRERTAGTVTSRFCTCAAKQENGQPIPMRLVADGAQRVVPLIAGPKWVPPAESEREALPVATSVSPESEAQPPPFMGEEPTLPGP